MVEDVRGFDIAVLDVPWSGCSLTNGEAAEPAVEAENILIVTSIICQVSD